MLPLPGHLAGAYLATKLAEKKQKTRYGWLIILLATLTGVALDIDEVFLWFYNRSATSHHELFSHTPLFIILVVLALWPISRRYKFPLLPFSLALISQIVFDSLGKGLRLLYPFSLKHFGLGLTPDIPLPDYEWVWVYLLTPKAIIPELLLLLLAVLIWYRSFRRGRLL